MTKEEKKQKKRDYYIKRKEWYAEYYQKNFKTPKGRATRLLSAYNQQDKKAGRNIGNLTVDWIIENIFTKPCVYCGKIGWDVVGCNRLDDSKPHTKDNVEPCCNECNVKLASLSRQKKVDQIDIKTGEVIASFTSTKEAANILSLNESSINRCCNGGYFDKRRNKWINIKQYKGCSWKRY